MWEKLKSLFSKGGGRRSESGSRLRITSGSSETTVGPAVPDLSRWAMESPEVRNEIAWCYAELDRLSSVCETQEALILDQVERLDQYDAELARSLVVLQERAGKEREMMEFITDANQAIEFALIEFERAGMDEAKARTMQLFTEHERYELAKGRTDERS